MTRLRNKLFASLSVAALTCSFLPSAQALTVRDDVTVEGSEERADDPQYDGVVQIYLIAPNGGVFFNCTGSLINPRTVISAAHCFNDLPSTAFGTEPGQFTPLIAYGPDTFDGLFNWLGTGNLELDERNGVIFGNQVIIHPDADPAFGNPLDFPGADVAMISLSNPLAQLPTYSMLFSQLPVGTHVQLVAYGGHGTGSTGNVSIDGKRQAGENILGLVGSQNDFLRGIFGTTDTYIGGPDADQLLYHIDFDNPVRNTDACSRDNDFFGNTGLVCVDPTKPINGIILSPTEAFVATDDIDLFPGDALPFESGTAGGDSGSALFADGILPGELIITGVLSGGWTFVSPAPSGYGDTSYYNPLFLFYDFIAESNPYKYVSAVAGDGNWSDDDHWVQDLDPHYLIIDENGNVVNGLPDGPEPGVTGTDPREGVVFDTDINALIPPTSTSASASGTVASPDNFSVTNFAANGLVTTIGGVGEPATDGSPGGFAVDFRAPGDLGSLAADPVETPELVTFLYGDIGSPGPWTGPGATGAVPNNGLNESGFFNYFDVTLRQAGTTTADIDVFIDTLTINNAGATLVIAEGVTFLSLVDTQIAAGTLDVAGTFASRDILNDGLVLGSGGTIVTDTLFNLARLDAGTGLNIDGDLVLTSASVLNYSGNGVTVDGDVALGGLVGLASQAAGQSGTLLTYTGERAGAFSLANFNNNVGVRKLVISEAALAAATAVNFSVTADSIALALSGTGLDGNSLAMAGLLDSSRSDSFISLQDIYDSVDFLPAAELRAAISGLSPDNTFQLPSLNALAGSSLPQHLDRRMTGLRSGTATAMMPRAGTFQLASLDGMAMSALLDQADAGGSSPSGASGTAQASRFGAFGEVSFSTGSQLSSDTGADSDIEGSSITLGFDSELRPGTAAGVFVNYSEGNSDFNSGLASSDGEGYLVGLYGMTELPFSTDATAYVGAGQRDFDTARRGTFGMATGSTTAQEILAGASLARSLVVDKRTGFSAVPELRVEYQSYDIDGYTETGNIGALQIDGREFTSLQLKAGADMHFYNAEGNSPFRPSLGLRYVYDLDGERDAVTAQFVQGGGQTTLVGASRDKSWGEVRGALHFGSDSSPVQAAVFAEGTVDRRDLSYVTLGLNVRAKF